MVYKIYIDFEYNTTNEEKLNLVSCALIENDKLPDSVWLYNDESAKLLLADYLNSIKSDAIIYAFNVVAEASAFYALGLNPREFKWVDLQIEWKMLTNNNYKYEYGYQLIKGKRVKTHPLPKYGEEADPRRNYSKPDKSLVAAVYKLLGVNLNLQEKDKIRDFIVANKDIESKKAEILKYNESDIIYLKPLYDAIVEAYRLSKVANSKYKVVLEEVLYRGRTAANIAVMTCWGYPVNKEQVVNFAKSVPSILKELAEDINEQFPDANLFEWSKARKSYSMKQKPWRELILKSGLRDKWRKTETGDLSLSLDAFTDHFSYRHDYPRGNWGAQALRYLKTKQSLNGFMPKLKGETFFDSLGSDSRVRSWLNPYGSQTARYQPKATSYIPLKAAWMRSLIVPNPGKSIVGIDYSSEEFLISACWANDKNMAEAYKSGDVYLYLAKLAGAVPWDGVKADYKKERDLFKATTLGISYLMGPDALARKLTADTGKEYKKEDAEKLIDTFFTAYPKYKEAIDNEKLSYIQRGFSRLPDGWIMWGDNPNYRSVCNFPIQGLGSCILRLAIDKALDAGLKVILPLHDALYCEVEDNDLNSIDLLADCMRSAFIEVLDKNVYASEIRLDFNLWGPYNDDTHITTPMKNKIKVQKVYIDDRSINEYEKFKKYLNS